jgi:FtsP/CotA-like multicopper oxidase with cupredoxin domain
MHLHGLVQTIIARVAALQQDTVMGASGQRVDVLVTASELGVWAFHCHVLTHAENEQGMYGTGHSLHREVTAACAGRAERPSPTG